MAEHAARDRRQKSRAGSSSFQLKCFSSCNVLYVLLQSLAAFLWESRPHVELVPLLQTCALLAAWHTQLQDHLDQTVRRLRPSWRLGSWQGPSDFARTNGPTRSPCGPTWPPPTPRLGSYGGPWVSASGGLVRDAAARHGVRASNERPCLL